MNAVLQKYLSERYRHNIVSCRPHAVTVEFGDVTAGMGRVGRAIGRQDVDFFVESVAIASRDDLDRWLVGVEDIVGIRTEYGCTDMWPHVSVTARSLPIETPIQLVVGTDLHVIVTSRMPSPRSVVVQLVGLRVSVREPRARDL